MRRSRFVALLVFTAVLNAQSTHEKRITPVGDMQRQPFDRQPKIAVLVGISAYPDGSGLTPLKYAATDVDELAVELGKQGYAVRSLKDSQATRGVVTRTLSQIGEMLDQDQGTLLFYFSGHGFAQNGVNYLATFGASVDDLQRDGLSLPEVEQFLNRSRAKRQILWVDACRNDPQNGARSAATRSFSRLDAAEGLRVLYSTRAGNVSYEDDKLRHGVFTYFLLRGLRGEAAGADGLLTFQDLAGYVSDSVMGYGVQTGRMQRPFEAGEASGDFLIAKANIAPSAGPAPTPETPYSAPPSRPSAPAVTHATPSYTPAPQPQSATQTSGGDSAARQREEQLARSKLLNETYTDARQALDAKRYDVAIESFKKAAAIDENQVAIWSGLADAYVGAAQQNPSFYESAFDAYRAAIALKSDDPAYYNNYALALGKGKRLDEARQNLDKAAQLDPAGAPRYFYNLGALFINSGQPEAAGAEFKKATEADPNYADAQYQYGLFLTSKAEMDATGRIVAAPGTVEALRKYIELKPNGPYATSARELIKGLGGQ